MLVSGNLWAMRLVGHTGFLNHTYCAFQLCEVVLFVSSSETCVCAAVFSLSLPPSLVDLVSLGLVRISTDLLSVMVSGGWLLLSELLWIPACPAQGSFLALEPPPALVGTFRQAHLLVMSLNKD